MLKTYFITGTDTDCGKTYVTAAMIDYYCALQLKAIGLKPIASGCRQEHGVLVNEDVSALQLANADDNAPPICNWLMPEPIAPHLAAKAMGVQLSATDIHRFCEFYPTKGCDRLLIEGAGGLMVPLNNQETWLDFLKQSQFPVIVVVAMRLGCINHALLTMAVLQANKIECAGWIANVIEPSMLALQDNLETLIQKIAYPLLGTVAFGGKFVAGNTGVI